jgi:NAD-dependent dihydropyrimidine dehydrogenase PreA subunit
MVWIQVNESKCDGCGECVEICPSVVFELVKEKSGPKSMDECVECCACIDICPNEAIDVDAC